MSFNARLPPSASYRARGRGNRGRGPLGAPMKTEDAQPNELLSKRNISGPPIIRASAPQPVRGRGRGVAVSSGSRHTTWQERGKSHYDASQSRTGPSRGILHHTGKMEDSETSTHRDQSNVLRPGLAAASFPEDGLPGWTPLVVDGDSRNTKGPTRATQAPSTSRVVLPDQPNGSQRMGSRMLPAHTSTPQSSSGSRQPEGGERAAIPPRNIPPLPRRQFMARARELPPHMDLAETSASHTEARDTRIQAPQAGVRSGNAGPPEQSQREPGYESARTSLASASASALLLSDLHQPFNKAASSVAISRPREDLPPPTKRRRLSPPPASSQTLFQTSASSDTDSASHYVITSDHGNSSSNRTEDTLYSANGAPKSRTASTQAASPQAPAIKRERSTSPVINAEEPRLVTEGCVRIAPLPLGCKAGRAGYQDARQDLTRREAQKLRELGLKPTRVFIREDGMVIDWKSDVPVMSDTLRPPPVEDEAPQAQTDTPAQVIDLNAGPSVAPAGPSDLPGQAGPLNHQGRSVQSRPPSSAVSVVATSGDTQMSAPTMQRYPPPPAPRTLMIPAPGETIWTRVFPPPRQPVPQPPVPQPVPPPLPRRHPAAATVTVQQQISPDLEIIDLTEEVDHTDSRSQDRRAPGHVLRPRTPSALREPSTAGTLASSDADVVLSSLVDTDEMQRGAVAFLERFLAGYNNDRSALASAYSRVATFSVQKVSSPRIRTHTVASSSLVDALKAAALGCAQSNPIDVDAPDSHAESGSPSHPGPYPRTAHHQGRADIIAALLDLPPLDVGNERSDSDPESDSAKLTVEWDLVHAPEAGDVLLICYAVANLAKRKGKRNHKDRGEREQRMRDKGKGKEVDRPPARVDAAPDARRGRMCIYEQRFLLRPREWDEEDCSTPGVWPLVAVAHQVVLRRFPS